MTIEEYIEFIVRKLGMAHDCEETERIISRSIELLKERHIASRVKADYLIRLKEGLKRLTPGGFDYVHWCNIQCAILYLKKLTKSNI